MLQAFKQSKAFNNIEVVFLFPPLAGRSNSAITQQVTSTRPEHQRPKYRPRRVHEQLQTQHYSTQDRIFMLQRSKQLPNAALAVSAPHCLL